MTPDQRQEGTDCDGAIDGDGAGGGGNVDEQDQHGAALLVIGRGGKTQIERQTQAQHRRGGEERQHRAGETHEFMRIGIAEQPIHLTTQIQAHGGRRREGT